MVIWTCFVVAVLSNGFTDIHPARIRGTVKIRSSVSSLVLPVILSSAIIRAVAAIFPPERSFRRAMLVTRAGVIDLVHVRLIGWAGWALREYRNDRKEHFWMWWSKSFGLKNN